MSHQLIRGKTTTQEVEAFLGQPSKVSIDTNGNLVWTYEYVKSTLKPENFIPLVSLFKRGTNDYHKELFIIFNQKTHRIKDYAYTSSTSETVVRG